MTASTVTVAASAAHLVPKPYEVGLVGTPLSATIATTSMDDIGDTVELGYLPANCTVLGFFVHAAALAASTLTYKIQVAGSDVITGITTGGAGAAAGALFVVPTTPLVLTAVSKVTYVVTATATTPAAGNLTITPLFSNA